MRKAITTKYLGPTNTKGSRIKAIAEGGNTATISRDSADSIEEAHCKAAMELATRRGWCGLWVGGGSHTGDGFVFVNLGSFLDGLLPTLLTNRPLVQGEDWFHVEP